LESRKDIDIIHENSLKNYKALARTLLRDKYELILTSPAEFRYNLLTMGICRLRLKNNILARKLVLVILYNFVIKRMLETGDVIIAKAS
jgi:hypothetical protein